jgi:hypothetical protein
MRPLKRRRPSWEDKIGRPRRGEGSKGGSQGSKEKADSRIRMFAATQKLMNGVNTADAQHSLCMLGIGEHRNTTIKTWGGLEWAEEARQ